MSNKKLNTIVGSITILTAVLMVMYASAQSQFIRQFHVDADKFTGTWFEVARTPAPFQDNIVLRGLRRFGPCRDATATYSLRESRYIDIENVCVRDSLDGTERIESVANGVGIIQEESENRKIQIAFGNAFFRFLQRAFTGGGGDFWIYGLGGENGEGQYSWALISGESREFIYILSRERDLDDATLGEILMLAEAEGLPVEELMFTQTVE